MLIGVNLNGAGWNFLNMPICMLVLRFINMEKDMHYEIGGIHSTVIACQTAGQYVGQAILHLGYDPYQNSSH